MSVGMVEVVRMVVRVRVEVRRGVGVQERIRDSIAAVAVDVFEIRVVVAGRDGFNSGVR